MRSLFSLGDKLFPVIYSDAARAEIARLTDNDGRNVSAESILADPGEYRDVAMIFSGWGAPRLTPELLEVLPNLRAFFYAAGSVRSFVTDAVWERDLRITSAYTANAVPVAEYTMASVILGLKQAWWYDRGLRAGAGQRRMREIPGVYAGSTVGVIALGAIGRLVCEKLRAFGVDILAYDPFAEASVFAECGAGRADSLEALFAKSNVATLHAPWLPETEDMITGDHLRAMPHGATFINTSRGAVVKEAEMVEVLRERDDLTAVIDVIQDESNFAESPLAAMPNVFLTPHIAGSMGRECHRMGDQAVEECRRFLDGRPALVPVTREKMALMA